MGLAGTDAILYYTPSIFGGRDGGALSRNMQFYANLAIGSCKFVGELVASGLTDSTGRRSLMVWGNVLLATSVLGGPGPPFRNEPPVSKAGDIIPLTLTPLPLWCSSGGEFQGVELHAAGDCVPVAGDVRLLDRSWPADACGGERDAAAPPPRQGEYWPSRLQ